MGWIFQTKQQTNICILLPVCSLSLPRAGVGSLRPNPIIGSGGGAHPALADLIIN